MSYRLDDIARRFGLDLRGDGQRQVIGVCSLTPGSPDRLAYLSEPRYAEALGETRAGAVIVSPQAAHACPTAALVAADPKLAYARVAALFEPAAPAPGRHASAVIDASARVSQTAAVGANAVIGADARIGPDVCLDPGCIIGVGAQVGAGSRVGANACIGAGVRIGNHVAIGAAVVIGDRGFGLVRDESGWQAIPQLGSVVIGDHVEIGAGSTIDRGAIEDTVLQEGVKLDDQVHIAHNCVIGAHTVIAGCTGIAGSSRIGRHCLIGGGVGIGDHVTIADGVVLTGATQVPSDIGQAGVYSSTLKAMPAAEWRKRLALLRKLDRLQQRLRRLERRSNRKGEGV